MAKRVLCSKCKVKKNVSGTGGFCRECATSKGFKSCSRCNKMFTPKAPRQKLCPQCRVNRSSGWDIGSYGGPAGLGKR
jgi:hypothetical protein